MRVKQFAALLCALLLLSGVRAYGAELEQEPIRVAFLDSGISTYHLDPAHVEPGENLIFPDCDTEDRVGHGTAAAGLLLGSAELGLAGLCPEAVAVPIVCYDRYPSGVAARGDGGTLAAAIRLAVDTYRCRILNISMGQTEDDPELRAAVEYAQAAGALIVAAVGNDNLSAPERVYYPAAYDGVIGVGAADGAGPAAFSQRSAVSLLAQGVGLSTVTNRKNARIETRSGTSFACAAVSGLCARLWQEDPALTAAQVRQKLFLLARDVGEPGFDRDSGWGLAETVPAALPADARLLRQPATALCLA